MKYLLLFITCCALKASAQSSLVFNKQLTESNNKWVALKTQKDSVYGFGFIYMDRTAGLTVHDAGSFKISKDNKFIPAKRPIHEMVKVRLDGKRNTVAWIPADRLKELDELETPTWMSVYKMDTASVDYLFRLAFSHNAANEIDKALYYLDRVKKTDPNYHGLEFEYIYAYNASRQFDKAIDLLNVALKKDPNSSNYLKELVFAHVHSGQMDKAEETYKRALPYCGADIKAEMAANILSAYLMQKNKEKSKIWVDDMQAWFPATNPNYANFQRMAAYQATLK